MTDAAPLPLSAVRASRGRVPAEPRLSPDGERISVVVRTWGRAELVVLPAAGGAETVLSGDPDPVGAHPTGGGVHCWTPDGSTVVYIARGGGLAWVPVAGGRPRPLAFEGALASPDMSPDGRRVVLTVDGRRVVVLDPQSPEAVLELTGDPPPDFVLDPSWSPDGRLVAWVEWEVPDMPWDSTRLVVADVEAGTRAVVAGGPGVSCQQARWGPHGDLGFVCDRRGWANLWVLTASEIGRSLGGEPGGPALGRPLVEEPSEHAEAAWGPGQRSWAWSPDGAAVAYCRNEAGFGRLCVADAATGTARELARAWHHGLSWRAGRLAAIRSGGRTATQVVVYSTGARADSAASDRRPARVTVLRGPLAGLEDGMVEPEAVEWPGDDGTTVRGRLYRPAGAAGPLPTIVWLHGGPTGQMSVTFNPRVGFFTSRGWAVLAPDYRGSTGWGRVYAQALHRRWGEIDVADSAAGIRAALERGWCRPGASVVMGASAGGFTALLLMAAHPELCVAGVDLYGVADLLDLAQRTHRYEAHYTHHLVGPLPGAEDLHRARSPLAVAGSIRCPLLVLHGADDEVVPLDQSRALAEAVRAAGGTVEMHVYEGEGHGWSRPETTADELERTDAFLRRHLG